MLLKVTLLASYISQAAKLWQELGLCGIPTPHFGKP